MNEVENASPISSTCPLYRPYVQPAKTTQLQVRRGVTSVRIMLRVDQSRSHFNAIITFSAFPSELRGWNDLSLCPHAADHTLAPAPIFRVYPNEISFFVAVSISPPLVLFKSIQFVLKQCFDPWFYQVQLFCVSNFLIPQHFVFILGQLLFSSASS